MPYKDPDAQREYQRLWRAKRRSKFFADKSCIDCGSTQSLELDHRDPDLKLHHSIWSWSEARQKAEIEKCDVRCRACHSKRHKTPLMRHGLSSYMRRKCRCDVCRAAKSAAMKRETRRQ